jgi:hypothetical protein
MLEKLMLRAAALAGRAAARRRALLAEALASQAPRGVKVDVEGEAAVLSGRKLLRRYALDPALRRLMDRLR